MYFSQFDIKIPKFLRKNKDMVVTMPDKVSAVVIVVRSTYLHKLEELISDRTQLTEITVKVHLYSTRVENKINKFLRKIKIFPLSQNTTYENLFVSGSGPGILHGHSGIRKIIIMLISIYVLPLQLITLLLNKIQFFYPHISTINYHRFDY